MSVPQHRPVFLPPGAAVSRDTVLVPRRLLTGGDATTPATLRLYAVLLALGADRGPVTIPVAELAAHLGYTPRHVRRALRRLQAGYARIERPSPRRAPCITLGSRVA